MKALVKYFAHYAEPECNLTEGLDGEWQHVVVIPAYRESPAMLEDKLIACAGRVLIILVLNRPQDDPNLEWVFDYGGALATPVWQNAPLSLHPLTDDADLLLVDRCSAGIPRDQGVGLARKIGADIACRLISDGRIAGRWIHTTDADALLPGDYFDATTGLPDTAAACCYPFAHACLDTGPGWPTLVYEWHLHYYVLGLRFAGSPYAFHTVGSTLAVDYRHYARVRGVPKRAGGEDFYLLNKLAKTGAVVSLPGPLIRLRARDSDRVPFGTGPATRRIAALASPEQFSSYHPACFVVLRDLLQLLDAGAATPTLPLTTMVNRYAQGRESRSLLIAVCERLGVAEAVRAVAAHSDSAAQRRRQLHLWFDAFRSLKSIHLVRDLRHANLNLCQLLQHPQLHSILPEAQSRSSIPLQARLQALSGSMRERIADGLARSALLTE